MEKTDSIICNAAQIVTCASNGRAKKGAAMADVGIIKSGAIAVTDGRIAAVGSSDEILKSYEAETTIDANRKVVAPAFVECHTHIVFAGNRFDEFEQRINGASYMEIIGWRWHRFYESRREWQSNSARLRLTI